MNMEHANNCNGKGQRKSFSITQGADTMIFDRLGSSLECRQYYDVTLSHLEAFARTGLRYGPLNQICLILDNI